MPDQCIAKSYNFSLMINGGFVEPSSSLLPNTNSVKRSKLLVNANFDSSGNCTTHFFCHSTHTHTVSEGERDCVLFFTEKFQTIPSNRGASEYRGNFFCRLIKSDSKTERYVKNKSVYLVNQVRVCEWISKLKRIAQRMCPSFCLIWLRMTEFEYFIFFFF